MSVPIYPPSSPSPSPQPNPAGASNPYVGYPYGPPSAPGQQPHGQKPRKGRAGLVTGVIAGAAAISLVAGGIGGAIGYLVADSQAGAENAVAAAPVAVTSEDSGSAAAAIDPVPALTGIADLAATVQPAVVQINVGSEGQGGSGSGFIISEDGYIVTNNHVAGPAGEDGTVEVVFSDGATATGTLVGADAGYDLAVVKVEREGLPTLELGSSDAVRVGDLAVAIGSPLDCRHAQP
jgi:Trypsin-like serine proteases, typically periplasmic, contain C-terminal PDZ domain